MHRIRLIEVHDRNWFPVFLRDQVTDSLQLIFNVAKLYRPIAGRLGKALHNSRTHQVLDLCSGAGGPWPWLRELISTTDANDLPPIDVYLTDKYPNSPALKRAKLLSGDHITFHGDPVDVMAIPPNLTGFRTLFTSFHHFRPHEARALLEDAVKRRQGIGIFEVPSRRALTLLLVFLVPVADLILTPFLRPFRWSRLLWTYLIPVVPLVLWFDGIISCLHAYSPRELRELKAGLSANGYKWEIGEERGRFLRLPITYLIGYPDRADNFEPLDTECAHGIVERQSESRTETRR